MRAFYLYSFLALFFFFGNGTWVCACGKRRLPKYDQNIEQHNLGRIYEQGREVNYDDIQAVQRYYEAAEMGIADAQYNLGLMYEQGRGGLPISKVLAGLWYRRAARQGHADANENYSRLCKESQGWPI